MKYNFKFGARIKISILLSIAVILMYFRIGIPIFPSFLDFDLSDIPIFFIALYFSPISGVIAMALKNIFVVVIVGSFTYGIGEFSNFLVGSSFIYVAGIVFTKCKGKGRYFKSYLLGTVTLGIVGVLSNYFLILPVYLNVLGFDIESIAGVNTILSFLIFYIVPYNLIKSVIIFVPTVSIFHRVKKINSRSVS